MGGGSIKEKTIIYYCRKKECGYYWRGLITMATDDGHYAELNMLKNRQFLLFDEDMM